MAAMDKVLQTFYEQNDCKCCTENFASSIPKCINCEGLYHSSCAPLVHDSGKDIKCCSNKSEVSSQHGKSDPEDFQKLSTAEYEITKRKQLDKISKKLEEINDPRTKTGEETEPYATHHTPKTSSSKDDYAIDEFVKEADVVSEENQSPKFERGFKNYGLHAEVQIPETKSRSQVPMDSLPQGRLRFQQLRYSSIATSTSFSSEAAPSNNPFEVDDYDERLNPFRDDELNETNAFRTSNIDESTLPIRTGSDDNGYNTTHTWSFTEILETIFIVVISCLIIYSYMMLDEPKPPQEPPISLKIYGKDIFATLGNFLKIF